MISRIRTNNETTVKADFLDLILTLKNPDVNSIIVMRKVDGAISKNGARCRDEYKRNPNGQWFRVLEKGKVCLTRIRVAKYNRQFVIENY